MNIERYKVCGPIVGTSNSIGFLWPLDQFKIHLIHVVMRNHEEGLCDQLEKKTIYLLCLMSIYDE